MKQFGSNYYQVTDKGLSREWGYVSAGYGEMAYYPAKWYRMNGTVEFQQQMVKMAKARAPLRRPAIEVNCSSYYRNMESISMLAWRGAYESDGEYAGYSAYADVLNTNEKCKGLRVAAASGDATLIGYAKQMLADNQYFNNLSGNYTFMESLDVFEDYQTIKNAADNGARLPMTDGQPDFVWSDEGDRIVALKQGNNRLWISAYWQAKYGTAINALARFHYSTPTYDQYGVLETTPFVQAGATFTRPNMIDKPESTGYTPPDNPSNAYAGEILPVGPSPAGATEDGPFRGKADFYAFRYGRYLIGLNAHSSNSYTLRTPVGLISGTNLVTGAAVSGSAVMVSATSTVVIDTGTTGDASPVPGANWGDRHGRQRPSRPELGSRARRHQLYRASRRLNERNLHRHRHGRHRNQLPQHEPDQRYDLLLHRFRGKRRG